MARAGLRTDRNAIQIAIDPSAQLVSIRLKSGSPVMTEWVTGGAAKFLG
jgi:hypothetical protein